MVLRFKITTINFKKCLDLVAEVMTISNQLLHQVAVLQVLLRAANLMLLLLLKIRRWVPCPLVIIISTYTCKQARILFCQMRTQ